MREDNQRIARRRVLQSIELGEEQAGMQGNGTHRYFSRRHYYSSAISDPMAEHSE